MSKSKSLSWNDRFALIDHYEPSDESICQVFGVSSEELSTARELRSTGMFVPSTNLDVKSYNKMFSNVETKKVNDTVTTHTKDTNKKETKTNNQKPLSASKKQREPKKRGRKGNKIQKAFEAIPMCPTPVEQFAQEHGVSIAVLRQSKRFDKTGLGPVHVKKDQTTDTLMVWREMAL